VRAYSAARALQPVVTLRVLAWLPDLQAQEKLSKKKEEQQQKRKN